MNSRTKPVAVIAGISAFLAVFENFIPVPIPFLRLGLSNIPVLLGFSLFRFRDILFIVLFKLIIAHLFKGTLFSYPFLVGLSGNLLFLFCTWPLYRAAHKHSSFITFSLFGAFFHNMGQVLMAMLFLPFDFVLWMGLILVGLGVVTGLINGIITNNIYNRVVVRILPDLGLQTEAGNDKLR